MSSPDKLNTNTSPSTSIYAIQNNIILTMIAELGEIDDTSFVIGLAVDKIGVAVQVLLSVGVVFIGFTSLGGAFVSGCPFRSAFSDVIQLIF